MEGKFYVSRSAIMLKHIENNRLHELRIEKGAGFINTSYSITEGENTLKTSVVSIVGTSDGPINERDLNAAIDYIGKMYNGPAIDKFISSLSEVKNRLEAKKIKYKDSSVKKKNIVKDKKIFKNKALIKTKKPIKTKK